MTPRRAEACRCEEGHACEHLEPIDETDREVDPIADTDRPASILADEIPW